MQKKQLRNEEGGTALHMPSAGVVIQTFQSCSQPSDEPNNLHMLNSFLAGEPPGFNPGAEMFALHKSPRAPLTRAVKIAHPNPKVT